MKETSAIVALVIFFAAIGAGVSWMQKDRIDNLSRGYALLDAQVQCMAKGGAYRTLRHHGFVCAAGGEIYDHFDGAYWVRTDTSILF